MRLTGGGGMMNVSGNCMRLARMPSSKRSEQHATNALRLDNDGYETMPEEMPNSVPVDPDWWRGAIIYEIYPRSYQDTTGDGTGDLKGITQRLAYIASLGVDAVWIAPFFTSPMRDFGYDVTNYKDVDPVFGTIDDFKTLVSRAHELGLRVMIDQVLSHSSSDHEWFCESRSSRNNAKADWYVWADAKPDGTPPNNWLSIFGGSSWHWDTSRRQYYLHNFLATQPDLNLHNRNVQDALLDAVRFWLELGVDGFRLDTVNFYFHDRQLRSNPPLDVHSRNASIAPDVNPYNYQDHQFDKNQPENLAFLQRFRQLLDQYPGSASVGEVGDAQRGMEIVAQYTAGSDKLHMCYSFDLLSATPPNANYLRQVVTGFELGVSDGWACWAFSNHDVERHASRWSKTFGGSDQHLKVQAGLLLSLRGSVCLYQGEELGLPEAEIQFEDLQDPYGIEFWPTFKGRDGCRTPMVWDDKALNAGFSPVKPWLPVPQSHYGHAVNAQVKNPESVLNQYRRFIGFRKRHLPLIKGSIELDGQDEQLFCFRRSHGNETIYCAFNLSSETRNFEVPHEGVQTLGGNGFAGFLQDKMITIPPMDAYFGLLG